MTSVPSILVLFDSRDGRTEALARAVAAGVRGVVGVELRYRTVDEADPAELREIDGLILGSPNWSGVTGKLKEWFDRSGDLWETGELSGKIGACFTAGWSRSGGNEATLLQLMHLILAHGMLFVGLPWTDTMRRSGSYYGATAHGEVTNEDEDQARALGRRVAELALTLARA